jgi:hypothetical protein
VLENIIAETGTAPIYVGCDNGPEFTAAALVGWCNTAGVDTAFIDPGSPWQNGFIGSFKAQFRREQLSGEIMDTMAEPSIWPTNGRLSTVMNGPTDPCTA